MTPISLAHLAAEHSSSGGTAICEYENSQNNSGKNEPEFEPHKNVWFVNAPVDLFLCCGGLLWIIISWHALVVPRSHQSAIYLSADSSDAEKLLAAFLIAGSFLFTYPHHAATWMRIYGNRAVFTKYWICSILGPIGVVALIALGLSRPDLIPWYVRITAFIGIHHWIAQCYGIAMIYINRAKYSLGKYEQKLIWFSCQLLIVLAFLRLISTPKLQLKASMGLDIEPIVLITQQASAIFDCILLVALGSVAAFLQIRWIRRRKLPPPAVYVIFATVFRITTNSADSCVDLMIYGLPFFHSLQYLVVSGQFQAKENQACRSSDEVTQPSTSFSRDTQKYFLTLLVLGSAVYFITPLALRSWGLSLSTATVLVYSCINFHHIFSDAFIWRLKDPYIRSKLA